MAATSEHSSTAFGPPFDDTDADIILRSSDRVDFMVYKVILSKASPVFKTLFSLPQPPMDTPQGSLPITDLAENSKVLAALLSVIYPHTSESGSDEQLSLNDLIAALDMARKYDMATASRRLIVVFKGSEVIKKQSFGGFLCCVLPWTRRSSPDSCKGITQTSTEPRQYWGYVGAHKWTCVP